MEGGGGGPPSDLPLPFNMNPSLDQLHYIEGQDEEQLGQDQGWQATESQLFGEQPDFHIQKQHVKFQELMPQLEQFEEDYHHKKKSFQHSLSHHWQLNHSQSFTQPSSLAPFKINRRKIEESPSLKFAEQDRNSSIRVAQPFGALQLQEDFNQKDFGRQKAKPRIDQLQDFIKAPQSNKPPQFIDWNIFNTHESYVIITKPEQVKWVSDLILKSRPEPILGVDCEGLAKGRPMSLLQMYFAGKCYLFDLLAVNPFAYGLREVMESRTIMKIFHDFCEDQSALINQYNLVCYFVFDTQIAHRVIQQAIHKTAKLANFKDNNISLADLLKTYIDVVHTKKHEISAKMKLDDGFWERRPLSQDMIDYATQDVCYLPMVYQKIQKEYGALTLLHSFYQHGQQYYEEMTVSSKIMRETGLCTKYAFINRHIQDLSQLQPGTVIQAFIKNYQEYGVYCSLNVGVSGIVQEEISVKQLRQYFDIGDIIQVQVEGFRRSGHVILKFEGPQNPSMFIPPSQVRFQKSQPLKSYKPYVKSIDLTYQGLSLAPPQHNQSQQLNQQLFSRNTGVNYQSSASSSSSFPNQSPLYYYQQSTQFYGKQKNQKIMNVQSPEFVPGCNQSFNSSNGDNTFNNTSNSEWQAFNMNPSMNNNSNTMRQGSFISNNSSGVKQESFEIKSTAQASSSFSIGAKETKKQIDKKTYYKEQKIDAQSLQQPISNPMLGGLLSSSSAFTLNQQEPSASFHKNKASQFQKQHSFATSSPAIKTPQNNLSDLNEMGLMQFKAPSQQQIKARMQSSNATNDIQEKFSTAMNLLPQGSQGGQVKGSRSSPLKSAAGSASGQAASAQERDNIEIRSILNDTIAKLSISQNQMKLVVSPNNNSTSHIYLKEQQQQYPQMPKTAGGLMSNKHFSGGRE